MSYSRLIDAEVLKERLNKLNWTAEKGFSLRYVLDDIIDNTPTVDLIMARGTNGVVIPITRPQGEWKEDLSNYDNHYPKHIQDIFHCSICGVHNNRQTNFCSNCGAKMTNSV